MSCKTCPFYRAGLEVYAQNCAQSLLEYYGQKEAHPCLEHVDALRPAQKDEPVCVGHARWLKKNVKVEDARPA